MTNDGLGLLVMVDSVEASKEQQRRFSNSQSFKLISGLLHSTHSLLMRVTMRALNNPTISAQKSVLAEKLNDRFNPRPDWTVDI